MKRNFILLAALLSVAILTNHLARPVWAQVRAALVQSIDEPARHPFTFAGFSTSGCPFCVISNFPAGKRTVVEQFGARCIVGGSHTPTSLRGVTQVGDTVIATTGQFHFVQPRGFGGSGLNIHSIAEWEATVMTRAYGDPGSQFRIEVVDDTGAITAIDSCGFFLSGYTVDLP
jgi:hypothetical protein